MPVEPPPTRWRLDGDVDRPGDLVGIGADLEPGTLLAAYRRGLFPMPVDGHLGWWSPARRAVLPLGELRVARSLRRSGRRFDVRIDTAFDEVVASCADPARPGGWITDEIRTAYGRLHRLGWAHSVEAWLPGRGLAGGLYGVAIGGLFAGESMFHRVPDASKVALVRLVSGLQPGGLLDVQWLTPHLQRLGAVEVSRARYLELLGAALALPLPDMFADGT
jgi:leucyl/phenylalanyl-tRNA--protein transferase